MCNVNIEPHLCDCVCVCVCVCECVCCLCTACVRVSMRRWSALSRRRQGERTGRHVCGRMYVAVRIFVSMCVRARARVCVFVGSQRCSRQGEAPGAVGSLVYICVCVRACMRVRVWAGARMCPSMCMLTFAVLRVLTTHELLPGCLHTHGFYSGQSPVIPSRTSSVPAHPWVLQWTITSYSFPYFLGACTPMGFTVDKH